MPKVPINYQNTEMYKLICDDTDQFYVGHTTNFIKRQIGHKSNSKTKDLKVYKMIREFGGWDNWRMVLIEKYPCDNRREAERREEELRVELKPDLNSIRCITPNSGMCIVDECKSSAQGKTDFCKKHGGGNRCSIEDCPSSARSKTDFCVSHGGGNRCSIEDCQSSARSNSELCVKHGGGNRCSIEDCQSSATGKTEFCVSHGGGNRCSIEDCQSSAIGKTDFCNKHGPQHTCTLCNVTISINSVKRHEKGKRHLARIVTV